ncbi:hypothetical protein [Robiginitalea sp. SC105]|uniref:tetratricopeptide repeat protein n=1 Tax=Robiginitalea sp. SC105 TaxID=2762332 RepID=UPI00163A9A47|nr:hypothetical protein [Robiginitalea sp. SC105]MBC2838270.1 hypothetical protein [Robiginitalea sp. SC105]
MWALPVFWCLLAGAQEEDSAEFFLESYSDAFQQTFFEALKEKGIENYDRAEALLLECKQMDPLDPVLDHELAKVLIRQKQYPAAEQYAVAAVRAEPGEYWYLHTLMQALEPQYRQPENLADFLPLKMPEFRINLATWYLEQGKGDKVRAQLEGLPATNQVVALRQQASQLEAEAGPEARQAEGAPDVNPGEGTGDTAPKEGSAADFEKQLEGLLVSKGWDAALELGSEAIETYPLQPFFYLAKGRALLGLGRAGEAVGVLEAGEEFLLETGELAIRIYTALAEGYTALGKMEKAAEYKAKIKNGSQ